MLTRWNIKDTKDQNIEAAQAIRDAADRLSEHTYDEAMKTKTKRILDVWSFGPTPYVNLCELWEPFESMVAAVPKDGLIKHQIQALLASLRARILYEVQEALYRIGESAIQAEGLSDVLALSLQGAGSVHAMIHASDADDEGFVSHAKERAARSASMYLEGIIGSLSEAAKKSPEDEALCASLSELASHAYKQLKRTQPTASR